MVKDYFQDITPPSGSPEARPLQAIPQQELPSPPTLPKEPEPPMPPGGGEAPERSIRNIQVSSSRPKPRMAPGEVREPGAPVPPPRPRLGRYSLWGGAALAILALGAMALVAFRPTTVTVIPRSQNVRFDETARFVAYPAALAATGTLAFTLETSVVEDSQVVPASGVEQVEEKASGAITVYNEYSAQSVRLIKNTRFETPEGLIFRAPAEIIVPGKKGATPGEITVTVFADAPGEAYNIGPVTRWGIPGLKSTPGMFSSVYARSGSAMSGGFAGERPAAEKSAVEAARAEIRARLQEKVRETARARNSETALAFSDLARVTFESLPQTAEAGGARIREQARVELPIFDADNFASLVAQSVSAEAEGGVILKGAEALSATRETPAESVSADSPIQFTIEGTAQLVWKVDALELAGALAGRDEAAFKAIVEHIPGIKEARVRIEPFWKNSFPADPSDIKVKIEEPSAS